MSMRCTGRAFADCEDFGVPVEAAEGVSFMKPYPPKIWVAASVSPGRPHLQHRARHRAAHLARAAAPPTASAMRTGSVLDSCQLTGQLDPSPPRRWTGKRHERAVPRQVV
jgi:hypothetical protein